MSRIIAFDRPGGPETLVYKEETVRHPGPSEVRIRVKAIGINRAESMWRQDHYIEPITSYPAKLGYEAAGIIDAVGPDVTEFAVGDEVNVMPAFSQNDYGMYGEQAIVPLHAVIRHPKSLSYAEAASLWMMFVTAYGALVEDAKIGKGDAVLITAASSSVGLAAIQIANYAGATPIAVTRGAAKRQKLLDLGAAHVIVTDEEDLVSRVMEITRNRGVDIAFDPIGGSGFPELISALKFNGTIFLYGALAGEVTPLPVLEMIAKMPIIKGQSIWSTSGDEKRGKAAVAYVLAGLEAGALKPVIDRVFGFDEMVEVHRHLERNGQFGKIVVTL